MKSILTFVLISLMGLSQAQQVEDYKYIVVPAAFSGFEAGKYQLNNYLKLLLTQKDYEVLSEETAYWPEEAKLNPCQVLTADVNKVKSTFNNKLQLVFKNCNNIEVASFEGSSKIKEFEKGYQDALGAAMFQIEEQNAEVATYRQEESKSSTVITTTTHQQIIRPKSDRPQKEVKTPDDFQRFSYDGTIVLLTQVEGNAYIITTENKDMVLANFYPSSLENVFHVRVNQGNQKYYYTIGYYDGETLWYDYTADKVSWTKIEFQKED